jgi:hypothetical protein
LPACACAASRAAEGAVPADAPPAAGALRPGFAGAAVLGLGAEGTPGAAGALWAGAGGVLLCGALGADPPADGATSGAGADELGAGSGSGPCARAADVHASANTSAPKRRHPWRSARFIKKPFGAASGAVRRTVIREDRPGQPGSAGSCRKRAGTGGP